MSAVHFHFADVSLLSLVNTFLVMHFISFSKKASIYGESQPFSCGWKCCPQAAIVTWSTDASLLQKRPQGLLFIHIFIFFVMYRQISIVKKSCAIPKGCAFQETKVCSGLKLNCRILGKREGILPEKHIRCLKELERVRCFDVFLQTNFISFQMPVPFQSPTSVL